MNYVIDCEAGVFEFQQVSVEETGMVQLRRKGKTYWYEPGDSYLYDAPEGGTSQSLGEVYGYGQF